MQRNYPSGPMSAQGVEWRPLKCANKRGVNRPLDFGPQRGVERDQSLPRQNESVVMSWSGITCATEIHLPEVLLKIPGLTTAGRY
jgi:hypothetical protein